VNKSRPTFIQLGFRDRLCGGSFPFTNTVTLNEQLIGVYGVPFLLQIFVHGFLRNSAENLTGNIITYFIYKTRINVKLSSSEILLSTTAILAPS
jgi:hypothetical protein